MAHTIGQSHCFKPLRATAIPPKIPPRVSPMMPTVPCTKPISSVVSPKPPFSQYYETARARAVGNGVKVTSVKEDDETEMRMVYDPSHPDADENGYVTYPNVNTVTEMTNLIDATRAYEANTTAFDATKSMVQAALNISK